VLFKTQLVEGKFGAGEETIESRLFDEVDIPWAELAFPSVERTLRHYFEDRKNNIFPMQSSFTTRNISKYMKML